MHTHIPLLSSFFVFHSGTIILVSSCAIVVCTARKWGDYHVCEKDERDFKQAEKEVDAYEVISKFNRHATLVLNPPNSVGGDVKLASSSCLPQDNPTVATDLEELHEPLPPETSKLILQNSTGYNGTMGSGAEGRHATTSRSMNSRVSAIINEPVHMKDEELKSSDCCILNHNPVLSNGLTDPSHALEIIMSNRVQVDGMNANMDPTAYQQVCHYNWMD